MCENYYHGPVQFSRELFESVYSHSVITFIKETPFCNKHIIEFAVPIIYFIAMALHFIIQFVIVFWFNYYPSFHDTE